MILWAACMSCTLYWSYTKKLWINVAGQQLSFPIKSHNQIKYLLLALNPMTKKRFCLRKINYWFRVKKWNIYFALKIPSDFFVLNWLYFEKKCMCEFRILDLKLYNIRRATSQSLKKINIPSGQQYFWHFLNTIQNLSLKSIRIYLYATLCPIQYPFYDQFETI